MNVSGFGVGIANFGNELRSLATLLDFWILGRTKFASGVGVGVDVVAVELGVIGAGALG